MSTPLITGMWKVVTGQTSAVLNITNVDEQGNVTGTIQMDASQTYDIAGTWSATTNALNFWYSPPDWVSPLPSVEFQGYLFQGAEGGLFQQPPGPVSPPYCSLLAGTWKRPDDVYAVANYAGWVAQSKS
jgi:hypothetical protein